MTVSPAISPQQYAAKWKAAALKETAAYFDHFNELCGLTAHPKPSDADPAGEFFTFQRFVAKESGRPGFADVWYRDHFGLEYKGKGEDLEKAYLQLLQYRDNLANPPLLIVSDFDTFEIHTNFNGTVSETYTVGLDQLEDPSVMVERRTAQGETVRTNWSGIEVLNFCFHEPDRLNPGHTPEALTKDAADMFQRIAEGLQSWMPNDDRVIARYLSRLIFCMFASQIGALPGGIITRLLDSTPQIPTSAFSEQLAALFRAMSTGGYFGADYVQHFNGGLFDDGIEPVQDDGEIRGFIRRADRLDWSQIEPSVFGTLFERIFDPKRRSQLGRHYTSREDIELLVRPVVMKPLEREWEHLKPTLAGQSDPDAIRQSLQRFMDRLGTVKVLDPACGSGNFLYVTLALLKKLEQDAIAFGADRGVFGLQPRVHPRQLHGIEIDPYAVELASIVVWIGYLQWKHRNGIPFETEIPILEPLENIRLMDAVIDDRDGKEPAEPEWPEVDYIVGNPPFLGGKRMRTETSDEYVDRLFNLWDGRVRRESDLCCYWFEKAREHIESGKAKRAGLLATQAIRGGANRDVLRRIKESGGIFFAESDRQWILDGAAVRISMVGFDDGSEPECQLDGRTVEEINSNLTASSLDLTSARRLKENTGISFMGDTKGGDFDVPPSVARDLLRQPNPHGKPNSDVVRPYVNGRDLTAQRRGYYIIDFGVDMSEEDAAKYEAPFEYVKKSVLPFRQTVRRKVYAARWWLHMESRRGFRSAIAAKKRYLATSMVGKHRYFVWLDSDTIPGNVVIVFAREDDYFFGVLHSKPHELWALNTGTQLREKASGFRYTPTTTFETFPFPKPTEAQHQTIAEAARELNELREKWLNPPEGSLGESELKKRTLTNLYNGRPAWLDNAHRKLDRAVFAAYGWPEEPDDLPEEEMLRRLLELNLTREAVNQ